MPEFRNTQFRKFLDMWGDAFFLFITLISFLCAFVLCIVATIKTHLVFLGILGLAGVIAMLYFCASSLYEEIRDNVRAIRNVRKM